MNVFGILNMIILMFYGILIMYLTIKHWDHPHKTIKIKISELIYGVAYILNGLLILFIFEIEGLSAENQMVLHGLMFICFSVIIFWLMVPNILRTKLRIKKHPEMMDPDAPLCRHLKGYWERLAKEYEKAEGKDIIKDLTRKALHFVILAVVILFHELPLIYAEQLESLGYTATAISNFIYIVLAFFFLIMFSTADLYRVYKFENLPDWALKWYGKSVEPATEKYTFISSVPFLLTLILFIPFNFTIVLAAAIVSCVADAAASIVGKNFGKHKMNNFGRYPNKSFEGFYAGASSAFLGVVLAFTFYPISGVTVGWQLAFGIIAAASFIYVDAFSKYVVDNVLNTLIPGLLILLCVVLFV
ncbi:MAG: hypothetical protein GF364_13775 [Candidatus Lokiarchaeota archaeon]|nr:hypothetical protein [Candidatus Lokiarchaeota archaeon]